MINAWRYNITELYMNHSISIVLLCSVQISHANSTDHSMVMNADRNAIPWNSDTTYALGFHRTLAQALGIWPLNQNKYKSAIQVTFNSILQLIVIIIFIQKMITVGNCSVITDILDALSVVSTSILSIMKLILPLVHNDSMFLIINSAIKDWSLITDYKTRKIMMKYAQMGRIVFIVQMIGAYLTITPLIFGNLPTVSYDYTMNSYSINTSNILYRNIPIGPNCWVSPTMHSSLYCALYGLITINLIILCHAYIGGDIFIFGIAMHVCGQWEVLYHNMENLDGREDYLALRKKIKQNSYRHSYLLHLTNEFEKSFNLIILLQVAANTFIIGISGILLLTALKTGNTEFIITSILRIYMLYFQLYIYSYIGESLSRQAEKLQVAIYNCTWYRMPPKLVQDLVFIMARNNYPFHLTAGKIYDMNIPNFRNLVKTMFSYFSVLRLMFTE